MPPIASVDVNNWKEQKERSGKTAYYSFTSFAVGEVFFNAK